MHAPRKFIPVYNFPRVKNEKLLFVNTECHFIRVFLLNNYKAQSVQEHLLTKVKSFPRVRSVPHYMRPVMGQVR